MLAVLLLPVLLCGAHKVKPRNPVEAVQAQTEIPETELLDVGIRVFDPVRSGDPGGS
jgi:hypothetical protein